VQAALKDARAAIRQARTALYHSGSHKQRNRISAEAAAGELAAARAAWEKARAAWRQTALSQPGAPPSAREEPAPAGPSPKAPPAVTGRGHAELMNLIASLSMKPGTGKDGGQ